jgi:predicted MFS family arabinose efflux permease
MTLPAAPQRREGFGSTVAAAASPGGGPRSGAGEPPPHPSQSSQHGLDWFVFFVANVQTGFGPFISVYLTSMAWTQVDIGFMLTIGSLVGLLGQMPGGAIVDAARSERFVAAIAVAAIGASALAFALWPIYVAVLGASLLHAAASCVLGPAMAAISLGLVGHAGIGERFGRNARFGAIGNGIAAAAMGACGYWISNRAVFFVTAVLLVPALIALAYIRTSEVDPERAHGGQAEKPPQRPLSSLRNPARLRPLLIFSGSFMLFQLANAAMLPLMGSVLTMRSSRWAAVLIAACIVVPQLLVALISPWIGHRAQLWGRRPLLLLGFAVLPIRGVLFAVVADPNMLVVAQLLDGISAAVFGVLVPLVIADVTRGTGHFNLALGIAGTAVGIGASLSTTLAGYISDHFGSNVAFLGLAGIAALGLLSIWGLMPETRPGDDETPPGGAKEPVRGMAARQCPQGASAAAKGTDAASSAPTTRRRGVKLSRKPR